MSFLVPAFLAGLGVLLIPVIIHLTQRQRSQVTAFPSLMFLRKAPFKTTNRRRIRHPLLFLLRCAAIALLTLAFARPLFETDRGELAGSRRDVVLLVDASASLSYEGRWDRVKQAARDALGDLTEGDRAAIVQFAEEAEERVALTESLEVLAAGLEGLELSDRATRIDAGLQLASRILEASDRTIREVVLISDFQRTGWEDGGRVRLPDGVSLRTVAVAETTAPNVAVAEATLQTNAAGRARVLVRLANMGESAVEGLPVSLDLGGRTVATLPVDLGPRGSATLAFEDVALPDGRTRARVTVRPDGMVVDDALRFMASAEGGLEALVLQASRGRAERSLFIERALAIGEAPRIRAVRRNVSQMDAAALATAQLVILNDGDLSDAGRATRLRDWVRAGGGLLVVLGPGSNPSGWSEAGLELLGGEVGATSDQSSRGGSRLSWLDYDHPVFELFSAPRSGDFSEARFFRFRSFAPGPQSRVVARFEGGEPALVEHSLGDGRVLVWTSSLDRFWNDLALQPVFLPFVHRIALHATGYREPDRWIATGGVLELGALVGREGTPGARVRAPEGRVVGAPIGEWVLVTPGGDRRPIEAGEGPTWIQFDEAGFYQVESLEDGRAITVAVNPSLDESDLVPIAPERVVAAVLGAGASGTAAPEADGAVEQTRRAELWWPLALVALLVLAAESIIANRWTRRRPASRLAQSA